MDVLDDPLIHVTLHLSEVQNLLDTLAISTEQNVVFMTNSAPSRRVQVRLVRSKHATAVRTFYKLCTAMHDHGHQPKLLDASR